VHILGDVVDQSSLIDLTVLCGRPRAQRAGAEIHWDRPLTEGHERVPAYPVAVVLLHNMSDEGILLVELHVIVVQVTYPGCDALVIFEEVRLPIIFGGVEGLGFRAVG
jgi:hypothetical protein